jgi:class 3 adenylate cyclase/tetratricopeptide (TPR) repeat protein
MRMELVVCPNCGEENPAKFRLCGFCGTALAPALPPQEVRKTVTIVFSDLKGSTNLGEALDPESLREVMTRYFDAMSAVLVLHGGTIEKFIGDAVMAVFGLPKLHEDDALRAVRAAHGMQQALVELNQELLATYGVELTNRTGVNTGEVVAGDPTTGQRLVTGDAVNTAARLEQAAPANEVLIGELTFKLVRGLVDVEAVEPLELKGKAERVAAYRLLDVGAATEPDREESPLVGRDSELAILEQSLADAYVTQRCRLVTVVGEAGVGKSRLIHEFLEEHASDAVTLHGRCLSYGDAITFWPIVEAVRIAAGIADEDSPEVAQKRILDLVDPDDKEREQVAERVAAAIGLTDAQVPVSELFWGIRRLFEALAEDQPLIVLFDDIHDAAPTFLELIEHLLDASRRVPIVLVCSARHELLEEHPDWEGRPGTATIKLEPLTAADAELFIDRLLGETALPAHVRQRVVDAAEGNPLYVEQMVRMLADERVDTSAGLADFTVPPSIQALIAARLDLLSREERAVVEPASVIGLVFPEPAVKELVPDAIRPGLGQHLGTLNRKQFVRPADGGMAGDEADAYRFHHVLIRDTAYNALLKRARATLHERFVAWAEQVNRERDREQEFEEILGYHLEQAFRYRSELGPIDAEGRAIGDRAAQRLAAAGRRAFGRGDLPAAANLLARAVALRGQGDPERIQLLVDLGEAQAEQGTFAEASATLDEAAVAAAGISDARLEARAILARRNVEIYAGDEHASGRVLDAAASAIPIFEAAGDRAGLARAWRLRAIALGTTGAYDEAAAAADRIVEYASAAGDARMAARGAQVYASVALVGTLPASAVSERCEQLILEVAGDRRSEAVIRGVIAYLCAMQGDFARAREESDRQKQMLADLGPSVTAMSTSIERARIEMLAGDLVAAEAELRSDDAALAGLGEQYFRSTIVGMLAGVLVEARLFKEAEATIETARQLADDDDSLSQVLWRTANARVLAEADRPDEAIADAERAVAIASDGDDIVLLGDAKSALGEVLWRAGRPELAEPPLREALALYERKGDLASASRMRLRLDALAAGADPTAVG